MFIRILLLITLFAISGTTASAQKHKNIAVSEYTIDDKSVSQKEFNDFLAGLKEQVHTWYCAETNTGGMTGYDAKDKDGVIYQYRGVSDSGSVKETIKKKFLLK